MGLGLRAPAGVRQAVAMQATSERRLPARTAPTMGSSLGAKRAATRQIAVEPAADRVAMNNAQHAHNLRKFFVKADVDQAHFADTHN